MIRKRLCISFGGLFYDVRHNDQGNGDLRLALEYCDDRITRVHGVTKM